jgi:hypothetical protein
MAVASGLACFINVNLFQFSQSVPKNCIVQGDHFSGKPGNVRDFGYYQGNVRDYDKSQGNVRGVSRNFTMSGKWAPLY